MRTLLHLRLAGPSKYPFGQNLVNICGQFNNILVWVSTFFLNILVQYCYSIESNRLSMLKIMSKMAQVIEQDEMIRALALQQKLKKNRGEKPTRTLHN